jgi:tetratricopeptide (TPR) repeat protein
MEPFPLNHPHLECLTAEIARGHHLVSQGEFDEARELLEGCLAAARSAGVEAPELLWALAVCSDQLGRFTDAFRYIRAALEKEPVSPRFRHSWRVIIGRIRQALLDPLRGETDADIPELHALLAEGEAADPACHLRLARFLLATERTQEACTLLEAVCALFPCFFEGWVLLRRAAVLSSDDVLELKCVDRLQLVARPADCIWGTEIARA